MSLVVPSLEAEIFAVKSLIDDLRAADTEFRVFGADGHEYRVGPKLPAAEIQAFEQQHRITLPSDYRLYLELVGNGNGDPYKEQTGPWARGGAGPSYGLYPLAETVGGPRISQPFPFTERVDIPYEPPHDEWDKDIPGALEICTMGCASHTHLVVAGPAYGTIWEGWEYDTFEPTGLTFIQWMRAWAEEHLQIYAHRHLLQKIKVGMTKAEVIDATIEGWLERRGESGTLYFTHRIVEALLELNEQGIVTRIRSHFWGGEM